MAFRDLSYGVYTATSMDGERPVGCIVNSSIQITSAPSTMCVSMNKNNYTHSCIEKTGMFAISVLSEEVDQKIVGTLGFTSSETVDKFEEIDYSVIEKMPIPKVACSYFVCKVVNTMDCGTHTIFFGEVIACDKQNNETPMTYAYYHKVVRGKSPKNAPTYIADEKEEVKADKEIYVCSICGYEHTGKPPFDELPDDFVCPICRQPKNVFKKK